VEVGLARGNQADVSLPLRQFANCHNALHPNFKCCLQVNLHIKADFLGGNLISFILLLCSCLQMS